MGNPTDETVHLRGSSDYEKYRTAFVNGNIPTRYPKEIHVPSSLADVVSAVKRANELGTQIGVRSGGHLFPCTSLHENGILVDMSNVNRRVHYDAATQVIDFGPAVRVKEAVNELVRLGRFFPTGHAPSVALGGFVLAGGGGWFMRGWGMTCEQWVTQLEIVTPDGQVVIANKEQNSDLFWAARGSGQWFCGIVTRIWGRTIPARKIWHRTLTFRVDGSYEKLLRFAFDRNRKTPRWGTETAVCTFYPEKYDPSASGDGVKDKTLLLAVEVVAYVDTLEEAETLMSAWASIPSDVQSVLVQDDPVRAASWDEMFAAQDALVPWGNGERWICDSILNDPAVDESKLINAIKPAFCNLPTRTSVGCLYIGDTTPDQTQQSCSLPQQYYIATFVGTSDLERDVELRKWTLETYKEAAKVSCGMYVADYDYTHRQAKVMTEYAEKKFALVKRRYDPENRFPSLGFEPPRSGREDGAKI